MDCEQGQGIVSAAKNERRKSPWARLPNQVVADQRLSAAGLFYVALRSTYAGEWSLSDGELRKIGIGEDLSRMMRREAIAAGYLDRHQSRGSATPRKYPSRKTADRTRSGRELSMWGRFAYATETLRLPVLAPGSHSYKRVFRSWFDPNSFPQKQNGQRVAHVNVIAALLFLSARGGPVFAREVRERFGWSTPTNAAVLSALSGAGIVKRIPGTSRTSPVRFAAMKNIPAQFDPNSLSPHSMTRTYVASQFPHEATQLPHKALQRESYEARADHASRGDAPTLKFDFDELWNLASTQSQLLGWVSEQDSKFDDLTPALHPRMPEMIAVADDVLLKVKLRELMHGRAADCMFSHVGLYTFRMLALWLQEAYVHHDEPIDAPEAQRALLQALRYWLDADPKRSVNSYEPLGYQIAKVWDGTTDQNGLYAAPANRPRPMQSEDDFVPFELGHLRKEDHNRIIASRVWKDHAGYARLYREFGPAMDEVIRGAFLLSMISDSKAGQIRTWEYFRPGLEQRAAAQKMAAAGLYPGDLLGHARRKMGRQ